MMSQLHFIERLEKLSEIGIILVVGSMLRKEAMFAHAGDALVVAGFLLFLIRPLGAWISTIGLPVDAATRWLYGWFGVRGVGSVYYLSYALSSGLKENAGEQVAWITLWTIAISVVLHGVTTTPIMKWYERNIEQNPDPAEQEAAETG
jgi:sodium/hydrogen antiporter